jgi:triosephosphate isomerase
MTAVVRPVPPTPPRRPLLAGNWKMHLTRSETVALLEALKPVAERATDREVVVAPPYTGLESAARVLEGSAIALAAQNVHWAPKGAYTGEIAAEMLADVGCTYVIIGHSERRQYFGETNETVRKKIEAALRAQLTPIVCVGEMLAEREAGNTLPVIERQVRDGLAGFAPEIVRRFTIAYEPVWAIGTGKTATPEQAEEVHAAIRALLVDLAGDNGAAAVRILYGGSVKADNIDSLMAQPNVDGALVGGASLEAESFNRIVAFQRERGARG